MRTKKDIIQLLEQIPYINISSVTPDSMPWISPVWSAYDEDFNFYWTSSPDSQHSKNFLHQDDISFVVYDSSVQSGGWGLYVKARAYELGKDKEELQKAVDIFYRKKGSEPRLIEDFLGDAPRRMYKAVAEKFWVNDYDKNRVPADIKVEINLRNS